MIDISALAPDLARLIGVQPSTLVLLLFLLSQGSRVLARRIPSDATGFWGFMRQTCAIIGFETPNTITSGTTSTEILSAAAKTPPIPEQIADDKAAEQ